MYKSIGYHTRSRNNTAVKLCGGSFGGSFDLETADRLAKAHFTVRMTPSGSLTFVDRAGRDVFLYVSVDPEFTEMGKTAKAKKIAELAEQARIETEKREEIDRLLGGLSYDEAIKRLSE